MIKSFLKFFKKEQMHFVILEELKTNPTEHINKILQFLETDKLEKLKTEKAYNQTKVSKYKFFGKLFNNKITRNSKYLYPLYIFNNKYLSEKYPKMHIKTRKKLLEKYYKEIEELETYLNKNLNFWKK